MDKQLIEDTQRFHRDLNGLLIHIGAYLVVNIILVIFTFTNFSNNWWLLFFIVFWSLLLVYHAIQMADKKKTTVKKLIFSLFVTS